MEGAQQFAAISIRAGGSKSSVDIFGGAAVLLFGDFALLRPVGKKSLSALSLGMGPELRQSSETMGAESSIRSTRARGSA